MDIRRINHNKGQIMIGIVVMFVVISLSIISGVAWNVQKETLAESNLSSSARSYYSAEAITEDVVYRIKNGIQVSPTETININGAIGTAVITDELGNKIVSTLGDYRNSIRKTSVSLSEGTGASFHYGVQAGQGGFVMENSSQIYGNLFSNGPAIGSGSSMVSGDVVSSGSSGLIEGIYSLGSAYSNTIRNSTISGDAYYKNIYDTSVLGTQFPDSLDQEPEALPISDELIESLKDEAEMGGIITTPCPYVIDTNKTIGPIKINCNLQIKGSPVVILKGNVWVSGDIYFDNGPQIKVDSSLGNKSVAMIADKESNRTSSSKIEVSNTTSFEGSGAEGSYVLLISNNNSSENGGSVKAIEVENSVVGDLIVFAGHGEIFLKNSINLKEVSAYKIHLQNTAAITYETGLQNTIFTSGPSGGFNINSWGEVE